MTSKASQDRTGSGKVRMRDSVAAMVRDHIHRGLLPPGHRLVEEELASMAGTSRTPVREALQVLEIEGLVNRRGSVGYEVRPFTARELRELVGVRSVLEKYAVKLAARRLSPEQLDHLADNLTRFETALKNKDVALLVDLNDKFHDAFYQAADNRILTRILGEVSESLHRFRVALLSDFDAANRALKDHSTILDALREGNYDEAAEAAQEHLLTGGRWMLAWMGEEDGTL